MPEVPDVLAGAFTRRAARDAGWTNSAVDRRLRAGAWVAVRAGVFHVADAPPLARAAAVVLATGGVASHLTAARVHGLWLIDDGEWATVPWNTHRRSNGHLRIHRDRLTAGDIAAVDGVRLTTVSRTLEDLCREGSRLQAVCAIESAVRLGLISPGDLATLRVHDDRRVRRRAAEADPRSESALETAVRLLLVDAGIAVVPQHPVYDRYGAERFRIDLVVEGTRVAIECDGREFHDRPEAVYRDRWRANELARSWVVLRFTWYDVRERPGYVVATVRATLARQAS